MDSILSEIFFLEKAMQKEIRNLSLYVEGINKKVFAFANWEKNKSFLERKFQPQTHLLVNAVFLQNPKPEISVRETSKFHFANSDDDSVSAHCQKTRFSSNGGSRRIPEKLSVCITRVLFGSDVQCFFVRNPRADTDPFVFVKPKKKKCYTNKTKNCGVYEKMMCLYTETFSDFTRHYYFLINWTLFLFCYNNPLNTTDLINYHRK